MNCRDIRSHFIMKYFDRTMTAPDQEHLTQHLDSCEHCRKYFTDFKEILDALPETDPIGPPPGLQGKIMAQIKQLPIPKRKPANYYIQIVNHLPSLLLLFMIIVLGLNFRNATFVDFLVTAEKTAGFFSWILILIQNTWSIIGGVFPGQVSTITAQFQYYGLLVILATLTLLAKTVISKLKAVKD